jgi:hypothetical protein
MTFLPILVVALCAKPVQDAGVRASLDGTYLFVADSTWKRAGNAMPKDKEFTPSPKHVVAHIRIFEGGKKVVALVQQRAAWGVLTGKEFHLDNGWGGLTLRVENSLRAYWFVNGSGVPVISAESGQLISETESDFLSVFASLHQSLKIFLAGPGAASVGVDAKSLGMPFWSGDGSIRFGAWLLEGSFQSPLLTLRTPGQMFRIVVTLNAKDDVLIPQTISRETFHPVGR